MGRLTLLGAGRAGRIFDPGTLFGGSDTGDWWDASDLTKAWQDSSATTPVAADGDVVGSIVGKKNGNVLTQVTGTKRPVWHTSAGLSWITSDGVDDFLSGAFTLNQPCTFVMAFVLTYQTNKGFFGCDNPSQAGSLYMLGPSPQVRFYAGTAGMVFDGVFGSGFVTTAQLNGASSRVAANNGSYVTGDPGANNPGGVTLFALDLGGLPSAAKFYGGVAISRLLTDSEIASCRTYFGAKAGLTL